MKTFYKLSGTAGALMLAVVLNCGADDDIKVYTVPKEHPAMQVAQVQAPALGQGQQIAGTPDLPINAAPIHWTTPASWEEKPADGIRRGSFAIKGDKGGKAEVAITSFPGMVGTELENVNRWRRELSLEPVAADGIVSEPVTVDSTQGKLYEIVGQTGSTVVAIIMRDGNSWFIKLRGEPASVAAAKPVFMGFLKSVRFGGDAGDSVTAASVPASADPHAGLGLQGLPPSHPDIGSASVAAADASPDAPKWSVPANWTPTAPRSMLYKCFSVADDSGDKAEVTVSFFPGNVGGVLANVNRWRGQMGAQPIDASQLDGVTESVAVQGGNGTMVDFLGTDSKTGQPARLVAVIVPHGDSTWFYKLMGNGKLVGGQKDSFVQFVKSVQYP